MSIDPAVVGRTYRSPRPYDVGREKVREFAESIGDPRSDYVAADAEAPLAPPTFAFVLTLDGWHAIMDDLEIEFSRVLHVDQRFVSNRPIRVGDVISGIAEIESVRERMGMSWLVIRTDIRTDQDEHVASTYSTILVRGDETGDATGDES
ncbi:MAG: MaoC family dehydratase N-terminal domain-containing protein [Actinomycetota bacterium]|jgi:acyl dehydratase|nr:MaoC family dehydratase N-terminal domain-containing protein [Actinomycetota bacterium]